VTVFVIGSALPKNRNRLLRVVTKYYVALPEKNATFSFLANGKTLAVLALLEKLA